VFKFVDKALEAVQRGEFVWINGVTLNDFTQNGCIEAVFDKLFHGVTPECVLP
jgi:hypothetical protein